MTVNEKKEYLSLYRVHLAKIRRLTELIGEYPEDAKRLKISLREAKMAKDKIEKEIEVLGHPVLVEILAQKYQCGKTLEEVAYCMNYSTRQIERLHTKALNLFERIDS